MSSLERVHKQTCSLEQAGKLKLLRDKIKDLLSCSVRCKLLYQKRAYYEFGNKSGRLLARSLRRAQTKMYISTITDVNEVRLTGSQDIANYFGDYYASLYNLAMDSELSLRKSRIRDIQHYLQQSGIQVLESAATDSLEWDITVEEFLQAPNDMPTGKVPGSDGLTKLYYSSFSDQLFAHFLEALISSPRIGCPQRTLSGLTLP